MEYTVQLPENSTAGKSLIQLSCVDKDEGSNGHFVFMIRSGINQVFSVEIIIKFISDG